MPLPTLTKQNQVAAIITEAKFLRTNSVKAIQALAAGPVSANTILGTCQRYSAGKLNILVPALTAGGVMQSLADELNLENAAAATAAVQAVIDAIDDVIEWVFTNFPKTSSGSPLFILKDTLNPDGSVTVRSFTPAQTANLRIELQKIVDAIGA